MKYELRPQPHFATSAGKPLAEVRCHHCYRPVSLWDQHACVSRSVPVTYRTRRRHLALALLAGVLLGSLLVPRLAGSHFVPGRHNAVHAIKHYFGPTYWRAAANVSYCEAGAFHWQVTGRPWDAVNGQYRNLFQMGEWERARFGGGPGPWNGARGAARYFFATGADWSPWQCKPWSKRMPSWLMVGV